LRASVHVRNTGARAGSDVVQLYGRDVYASVTRPVAQLLGYARVFLEPGQEAIVDFDVPTTRLAFTGRSGRRIVEPGAVELWVGGSSADKETTASIEITGAVHAVTASDRRVTATHVRTVVEAV
jgi:beta-glucosidase